MPRPLPEGHKNGAKTFAFKYWSPILAKTVTLALGLKDDITLTEAKRKVGDHRREIAREEDPRARKRAERRKRRPTPRNYHLIGLPISTSSSTR